MKRVRIPRLFFEKLLLLLILFIVVSLYVVLERTEIIENLFPTNTEISSSQKGIPFINDKEEIAIYSVSTKTSTSTKLKAIGSGIFSGNGGNSMKASPDFTYSAAIDADKHDLWLISNETFKKVRITKKDEVVGAIIAWSPKGDKILYELDFNAKIGIGGMDYGNIVSSKPRIANSGKYIYNLRSRKVTKLPKIDYYEKFLGDFVLFRKREGQGGSSGNQLYALNTNTFKVTTAPFDTGFDNDVTQYDISRDRKKWTFSIGIPVTDNNVVTQITYADYPQKHGIVIYEGEWAHAQWPLISPDAKKVIFLQRSKKSAADNVIVYDADTKKQKVLTEGTEAIWFDNVHVLTLNTAVLFGREYNLVNIETGKKELIQ